MALTLQRHAPAAVLWFCLNEVRGREALSEQRASTTRRALASAEVTSVRARRKLMKARAMSFCVSFQFAHR